MLAAVVLLVAAVAGGAVWGVVALESGPPEVAANAPAIGPYVVDGNVLVDGEGKKFFLHGVDRPSLEWACDGQSLAGQPGIPASDFATITTWGANAVRLSLNQDYWLSAKGHQVAPGEQCPNYVTTVERAVKEIESHGMAVILDLHASDPGNPMLPAGPQEMPDEDSVYFWQSVAKQFGKDWNVFFEVFNEPHGVSWSIWQHGGMVHSGGATYQAVGMQALVDAVRGIGVHNVILVDGPQYAATLQQLPSHQLSGGGIAYAVHPYQGEDGMDPNTWQQRFGFLTDRHVVVATEFGDDQPGRTAYDQAILSFFRSRGIGWTAWAWWDGGYRFPSIVSDSAGLCADAGCTDEQALQAFASGSASMALPSS